MNYIKNSIALVFCLSFGTKIYAQDLDQLMNQNQTPTTEYTQATFKGTKILNSQSLEVVGKGVLQIMFQHRFGPINNGLYDFFGLDYAGIHLGADYGVTKNFTVGFGRSGGGGEPEGQKAYDVYFKYKLLRQSSGAKNMPISMTLFASSALRTANRYDDYDKLAYRLFYTTQLIIGRKFSPNFSMQLMPTLIHRNLTLTSNDKNLLFSLGVAARHKISKRFGVIGEYIYTFPNQLDPIFQPHVAAIGLEIETGGHVYHLMYTNATGMIEHQYIGYNMSPFSDGLKSIRFGFNLSRVFTLVKPKVD